MFILSVRASTVRLFSIIALCILGLSVAVLGTVRESSVAAFAESSVNYSGIKDDSDRRAFIAAQGYTLAEGTVEEVEFSVPSDFDRVIAGYNEIQKKQGLSLEKYKGKKVKRYTYAVTNYEGYEGTVYANLIIYRSKVIACDVSSADPSGFVTVLVRNI